MTATTIRVQMAQRKDTAANWTAANPILLSGEIGYETDTKKFKIGNGSSNWNSLAYLPIPDGSGNLTITGNLEIGSTGSLTFEGSTADGFETTLAVTNPTADRTITMPNQSGVVLVSGNASIVDADIAANAEIAVSKLADGTARQLLQTDAAGTNVEWTSNVDIPGTLDVTGAATFDATVTVAGDLTVNGTTTTISTQNLLVEDKNIIIGDVASPTDVTADGGGITLKGATDKTINWVDATDAWTSSERFSVPLGSAASPSLTFTGDNNTGIYSPGADQVAISTGATERARIDSSGRLLVGTSTGRNIADTAQGGIQYETANFGGISITNNRGDASGATLAFGKQRSGSVGGNTIVQNGDGLGAILFGGADGTDLETQAARIEAVVDGTPGANDMPGRLVFSTTADGASSPTERMTITSAGAVLVNNSSPVSGNSNTFNSADTSINSWALAGRHTAGSGNGRAIIALLPNETANTSVLFLGSANSLDKFIVWSDGNVVNANNSYGGLSDVKLKENIVDANPQWDDIKALQVRNYNFKEGQTHTQIGLVAQEVELVSPGLVTESPDRDAEGNDLGTVTKSVNYSVLYMKAVKALQEAMERIELLEARLDAANL